MPNMAELSAKIDAVWTQLDDLALSTGDPTLARELLARNRDLMRAYDGVFQRQAIEHPVTSQAPASVRASANNGSGGH